MGKNDVTHSDLFDVEVHADGSFVIVRSFKAPITADLAAAFMKRVVQIGAQVGTHRCLVDVRDASDESDILDQYDFAHARASDVGLGPEWSIAVLTASDVTSYEFLETAMFNAGYRFKVFDNEVEALEWLGILPSA